MASKLDRQSLRAFWRRYNQDRWFNFSALRWGWLDGILISSKNSGTHWLKYMLSIALAEQYGHPRPEYYSAQGTARYIGAPKSNERLAGLPKLGFAHTIPHQLLSSRTIRTITGTPPIALLVRDPADILESHFTKWHAQRGLSFQEYLQGDPTGQRYKCDIYWLARFWNRWGEMVQADPDNLMIVKYEDIQTDLENTLLGISEHFGFELGPLSIAVAIDAGTKAEMRKHQDPEEEPNIIQDRKTLKVEMFSKKAQSTYETLVGSLFRYDLGYDLLDRKIS